MWDPVISHASAAGLIKNYFPEDEETASPPLAQAPSPEPHGDAPRVEKKRRLAELITNPEGPQTPPRKKMKIILSGPGPSPQVAPTPAHSIQQTPTPSKRCEHNIHPAYAAVYNEPECPRCRMMRAMKLLWKRESIINEKGGVEPWLERVKDPSILKEEKEASRFEKFVRGSTPKKLRNGFLDKNGQDTSHKHNKKRLINLVLECEELNMREKTWDQDDAHHSNTTLSEEEMKLVQDYSADNALKRYHNANKLGLLTRIEEDGANFRRKRGREWEISTDPDYPEDDFAGEKEHVVFKTTPQQRAFIDASNVPTIEEVEAATTPSTNDDAPKRKRRRTQDAKVSFNTAVHVLLKRDIDDIRKSALSSSTKSQQDLPLLKAMQSCPGAFPYTELESPVINSKPALPYNIHPLKDSKSRKKQFYSRKFLPAYQPGDWAPSAGSEIVDTSGFQWKGNFDIWDEYIECLQDEAEEMDAEEEDTVGEDTDDTVVGADKEEGSDVPWLESAPVLESVWAEPGVTAGPTVQGAVGAVGFGGVLARLVAQVWRRM
ncbi:Nn.00g073760.m01.CDS01 [Neocucurbitaria sp. VM-36]